MLVGKGAVEASSVSGTTSFCVLGKAGVSDYGQKVFLFLMFFSDGLF